MIGVVVGMSVTTSDALWLNLVVVSIIFTVDTRGLLEKGNLLDLWMGAFVGDLLGHSGILKCDDNVEVVRLLCVGGVNVVVAGIQLVARFSLSSSVLTASEASSLLPKPMAEAVSDVAVSNSRKIVVFPSLLLDVRASVDVPRVVTTSSSSGVVPTA